MSGKRLRTVTSKTVGRLRSKDIAETFDFKLWGEYMIIRVTARAALLAIAATLLAFVTSAAAQTVSQAIALIGQKSAEMTALQNKGITGAGETADDRRW